MNYLESIRELKAGGRLSPEGITLWQKLIEGNIYRRWPQGHALQEDLLAEAFLRLLQSAPKFNESKALERGDANALAQQYLNTVIAGSFAQLIAKEKKQSLTLEEYLND